MKPSTVLIIDDSEDDVLLTTAVLAKIGKGLRMESALGGEEGLSLLRSAEKLPALVLLDLKMPAIDGIEVLRRIRENEKTARLTVVIVTNSDLEADRKSAFNAGADDFLHKSYDLDKFRKDLEQVLERRIDAKFP